MAKPDEYAVYRAPELLTTENSGDKDDIRVVTSKSVLANKPFRFLTWEAYVQYRRVVPFRSVVSSSFYEGKVKGKDLLQFTVTIPTGIVLSHKGKEWAEEHQLKMMIPTKQAVAIAEGILKSAKRHKTA